MELRTHEHLATAERNRAIATLLIDPVATVSVQPAPSEWVAVLAFYSAVHLVNGLLWERLRYERVDHSDRQCMVGRLVALRPIRWAYVQLRRRAFDARYKPAYRLAAGDAEKLLSVHLASVEREVYAALGLPLPARSSSAAECEACLESRSLRCPPHHANSAVRSDGGSCPAWRRG